jgi:hypothetical protein
MRRLLMTCCVAALALGVLPAAASAATASCQSSHPALRWDVVRDTKTVSVSLASASFSQASAVKPVVVTVLRNGSSRTLNFNSPTSEFTYRPARGEQARFMATYVEDSSGYQPAVLGITQGLVPVALDPLVQAILHLPGAIVPIAVPSTGNLGVFGANQCGRVQALLVGQATASRRARIVKRY